MTWNQAVVLGLLVTVVSILLGRGSRTASEASLERRCRWAIRLALGYAAALLVGVLIPLARFAYASWFDASATPEQLVGWLELSLASALNLVLGFLFFGMTPTAVAFMVARRMKTDPQG